MRIPRAASRIPNECGPGWRRTSRTQAGHRQRGGTGPATAAVTLKAPAVERNSAAQRPQGENSSLPNAAVDAASQSQTGQSTAQAATATAPAEPSGVIAQAPKTSITAIHSTVVNVIHTGLNWLNGLPANPITDLISGALLLVRRQLAGSTAAVSPAALVPTSLQVNNTFVVNTLDDSGAGSLRQAILDANAAPGADKITFAVAGTIRSATPRCPRSPTASSTGRWPPATAQPSSVSTSRTPPA